VTAYIFVFLTGLIPFMIVSIVHHNKDLFNVFHWLFSFTCPTYIPYGLTMTIFNHQFQNLEQKSAFVGLTFLACIVNLLWGIPLWLLDRYINGIPLLQVIISLLKLTH